MRRLPLLLLLLSLTGCAVQPPAVRGSLRVGIAPAHPPIAFEQDGELRGLEVDFARRLERDLGVRLELHPMDAAELIPSLRARRIDIVMSGMSVTVERAAQVAFAEPYMQSAQMALIRRADVARYGRPQALLEAAVPVAVERGSGGEAFVRARMPRARAVSVADAQAGLAALLAGEVEVLVHDAPTVWRLAGEDREGRLLGLFWPLTREQLAWAVRREDQALRETLSATVRSWRRSGLLDAMIGRWMPVRVQVR